MEGTFKIEWLERATTSTGKAYAKVTLEGHTDKKVSLWSDFPDFANLTAGREITGELKQNDKGYWNVYPPRTGQNAPKGGAYKQQMVEKSMERKEASIERFQNSKEESIALASAQRDAVLIVVAMMSDDKTVIWTDDLVKKEIVKWRNWFLSEDFTDHPPF